MLASPLHRATATNLVAIRGEPTVWLIAHLDSKSQPVPMLARVAGIVGAALALVTLAGMSLASLLGASATRVAWMVVAICGVAASLPVILSTVGADSAGAVDDASGVATVLRAVSLLPRTTSVGVALTSAEELGMAGARAFASVRAPGVAINVDGVDDHGPTLCMVHGGDARARDAIATGAQRSGASVRFTRTIPGILTDGVALANAGWSAVTLSRGTFATLARVHRATDNLAALRGDGVEDMARLVAAATREID